MRSFDQGRVFGRTFSIIGRNIGLWLGLAVIFSALPSLALELLIERRLPGEASYFAAGLISMALTSLLTSSLVRATVEDLSGKRPTLRDSIGVAWAVALPAIGLGFVTTIGMVLGLALLVVPGVMLWVRWALAAPVLVQERLGVTASMSRSAALTAGFRWPLFGLLLILLIAAGLIQWAISTVEPLLGPWQSRLVAALTESVMATVLSTASAVAYVELREIKEGTSVAELAEIFA